MKKIVGLIFASSSIAVPSNATIFPPSIPHIMKYFYTVLCFILLSASAFAQSSVQDSLRELSRRIDILAEEMERMKLGEVADVKYEGSRGLGPAAAKVYQLKKSGVSIAGYGEMLYENYTRKLDNKEPSKNQDQFDFLRNILYIGYRFNDWILFNSEIEIEHGSTGKFRNGKPIGEIGIEFGYMELMFSKHANLRVGMMLVPVGIVNEKHEPSTFFGTKRPQVEQVIIPSTWRGNGAGFYGEIISDVSYRIYLLEGLDASAFTERGIREGRQSGAKAFAENLALTGRLDFTGLDGAILGASFFNGNSNQSIADSLDNFDPVTTVFSVHGEYAWKGLEARALYTQVNQKDAAQFRKEYYRTLGSRMTGWYAVAGYDLMPLIVPGTTHYFAPFAQYEKFNTHAKVPEGLSKDRSLDRTIKTAGITYKPHPNVAFKIDYRWNANKKGTDNDQWNMAVNYLF